MIIFSSDGQRPTLRPHLNRRTSTVDEFDLIAWAHVETCNDEGCPLCAVPADHGFTPVD